MKTNLIDFYIGMELNGGGKIIDVYDHRYSDFVAAYNGEIFILMNKQYEAKDFPERFFKERNKQKIKDGRIIYS